ncbi:hypothetical protein [Aquabacterium sp.]|uniref:hypothetical protein n=1 Tax=Aquabacterium sp. TaxID=1872578 RepID=UPI0035AE5DAC
MLFPRLSHAGRASRSLVTLAAWCAALCASLAAPAAHAGGQTDVGVSVNVSQPGFYGQINIGNVPPPVVYAQPVIIAQPRQPVRVAPIYLRVPPGHEKHWSKHCREYNACGRPVYFVRYDERDERRWHEEHDRRDDHRDRHDDDRHGPRDDDRGPGHDHGHGHGHGRD